MEDRNHPSICPDNAGTKLYNKGVGELGTLKKNMETALEVQIAVLGIMKRVRSSNNPTPYYFGCDSFGSGLTITGILCDQENVGWINFLCGRWSMKWKGAQKRHHICMNKKKSACL